MIRLNQESKITYFEYTPPNMIRITVLVHLSNEKTLIRKLSNYFAETMIYIYSDLSR